MSPEKIKKQISFITEIEKLKTVYRQNGIINGERHESSAEHSWHIAVMATLLLDEEKNININRTVKMLLIHDIVELDAGDNFLYSDNEFKEIKDKEVKAALRIFGLLPDFQKTEMLELWYEFEKRETNESKFANAIDALQPLINHYITADDNYNPHSLTKDQIIQKKIFIKEVSEELWQLALEYINLSCGKGLYID